MMDGNCCMEGFAMSKRCKPPGTADDALERFGQQIAEHFGIPLEQLRYATYRPFVDGRLTTESHWERLIDEQWVDAEWLPELHRTPVAATFMVERRTAGTTDTPSR